MFIMELIDDCLPEIVEWLLLKKREDKYNFLKNSSKEFIKLVSGMLKLDPSLTIPILRRDVIDILLYSKSSEIWIINKEMENIII